MCLGLTFLKVAVEEGLEHVIGWDGLVGGDHVAGALDGDPRESVEFLVPTTDLFGLVRSDVGPLAVFFLELEG